MNVHIVCEHASTRQRLQECLPDVTLSDRAPDAPVDLLVRWGSWHGSDLARTVLNPRHAVEACRYHQHVVRVARVNRIGAVSDPRIVARYRIYLFDMRSYAITRRVGKRGRRIKPSRTLLE